MNNELMGPWLELRHCLHCDFFFFFEEEGIKMEMMGGKKFKL